MSEMSQEQMMEEQKKNCLFCKIISGEIPSQKIYEDDNIIGIMDINPASEGHILLLPKEHYQIMPQIPDMVLAQLALVSKKISNSLLKIFKSKGITFFIGNGYVAGQKAPHFIMHLIPRKETDDLNLNIKENIKLSDEELNELKVKLFGQQIQNNQPPKEEEKKTEPQKEENKQESKESINKEEKASKNADLDNISKLF